MGGGNDEREQTLNQILTEMDGFQGNTGIIVVAATNRSEIPAKKRRVVPGRIVATPRGPERGGASETLGDLHEERTLSLSLSLSLPRGTLRWTDLRDRTSSIKPHPKPRNFGQKRKKEIRKENEVPGEEFAKFLSGDQNFGQTPL